MKNYPLGKYSYFRHPKADGSIEIIAMSTYAGKVVKGRAKCHPNDNYNYELGKRIAAARCGLKIAEKRMKRADNCCVEAVDELAKANKKVSDMINYYTDSVDEFLAAQNNLNDLLKEVKNS